MTRIRRKRKRNTQFAEKVTHANKTSAHAEGMTFAAQLKNLRLFLTFCSCSVLPVLKACAEANGGKSES